MPGYLVNQKGLKINESHQVKFVKSVAVFN
jgi:hypothetical protein